MATKLQNLERVEGYGKTYDARTVIDREAGSGVWTVMVQWSSGDFEAKCWGRGKTLESALADLVGKMDSSGVTAH